MCFQKLVDRMASRHQAVEAGRIARQWSVLQHADPFHDTLRRLERRRRWSCRRNQSELEGRGRGRHWRSATDLGARSEVRRVLNRTHPLDRRRKPFTYVRTLKAFPLHQVAGDLAELSWKDLVDKQDVHDSLP